MKENGGKAGKKKSMKEVYQAESWPAREARLWLEVRVILEGATRFIIGVAFVILEVAFVILEEALLTWLEIKEEVLTDMMTSSN